MWHFQTLKKEAIKPMSKKEAIKPLGKHHFRTDIFLGRKSTMSLMQPEACRCIKLCLQSHCLRTVKKLHPSDYSYSCLDGLLCTWNVQPNLSVNWIYQWMTLYYLVSRQIKRVSETGTWENHFQFKC